MSVPSIEFPLTQDQIKPTHDMLVDLVQARNADISVAHAMLKLVRQFCKHPNKTQWSCLDCGADWGD